MKRRWVLTGALALVVSLAMVVGLTQAQGPGPGGNVQPRGPVSPQRLTLENQQLGFVPASGAGVGPRGRSPKQPADDVPGVEPSGLINYQGRLLQNGSPYDGSINITFRLYTVASGGGAWWQETQNVQVDEGLFNVMLGAVVPLDDQAVNFQIQQWLGVQPAGAASELTPRQPLGAVAYAMNLMPGATMVDTNVGGPYGYSFWISSSNHPAIYARSESSTGISANSDADIGIYGSSDVAVGVFGRTYSDDYDNAAGVWGERSSGAGTGVRGHKAGDTGVGVRGTNYGSSGSGTAGISTNYVGTWGESTNDRGVYGRTGRADNNYGLYTPDNLYSLNYHLSGAVMRIVQNAGNETLEQGDVVVFSGVAAPLEAGGPPVIRVAEATSADSTAVAGIVVSRYNVERLAGEPSRDDGEGATPGLDVTPTGPVSPGDYMLLVVQGPALVKASAVAGAIQPGDLLSSSRTTGYAAKVTEVTIDGVRTALPGAVLCKALEPLDADEGLIYVYVTLQ